MGMIREQIELVRKEADQMAQVGSGGFPLSPFIRCAMFPTRNQRTINHPVIFSGAGQRQLIQGVDERLLAQLGLLMAAFELLAKLFEIHRDVIP
jgi:hypothetical protein